MAPPTKYQRKNTLDLLKNIRIREQRDLLNNALDASGPLLVTVLGRSLLPHELHINAPQFRWPLSNYNISFECISERYSYDKCLITKNHAKNK